MARSRGRRRAKIGQVELNLPNILTISRLALVPVFLICAYFTDVAGARWAALVVFIVAAVTDHLDGKIARARNQVSDFGKIWDPIADKALTLGAFLVLSITGIIPWWFTIIVAIREFGITYLRSRLKRRGVVLAASNAGKMKTFTQMLLIVYCLIPWFSMTGVRVYEGGLAVVYWMLLVAAFTFTLYSAWGYLSANLRRR